LSYKPAGRILDCVIRIKVNGQDKEVGDGTAIRALLGQLNLVPEKVAIELNRRLVRGDKYETALKDGDEVEVVTFVGGG
jgi:thiamine biosynthesis protein ThiS